MKDKDDRIKELAKDMGIGFQLSGTTRFGPVAAELVEMGYQRIKKDDIVISKEEYYKYQNLKRDVEHSFEYDQGYTDGQIKGSKETAEKCIKVCKKYKVKKFSPVGIDQRDIGVSWIEMPEWKLDEFAKQFDIEVKE